MLQYFENRSDFAPTAEVGDGETCLTYILQHEPDWAVIDLSMPKMTGFDVLSTLLNKAITTRIIVMSMHADSSYADRAKELGASGFIAKEDALSELDHALSSPIEAFYTSKSVGRAAPNFLIESDHTRAAELTPKEESVLRLLALGQTNQDIADQLCISIRTVHAHRRNMVEKLDLRGPNRLMQFAVNRFGAG